MTRSLLDIDSEHPLELTPYQHNIDRPSLDLVDGTTSIKLTIEETNLFLNWMGFLSWKEEWERDLQSICQDSDGNPLVSTWMPLVTFRERVCLGGRHIQSESTQRLMEKLRQLTRNWREHGIDTVDISGRLLT